MRTKRGPDLSTTKGLINRPGENNCFVNSVIQLLWHTDAFRRNFLRINFHTKCEEIIRMQEEAKLEAIPVLSEPISAPIEEPVVDEPENASEEDEKEKSTDETEAVAPIVQPVEDSPVNKRCMVCALQSLFIMFRYSDQSTIPPTMVRKVMSNVFEEGKMHSALDAFDFVLQRLREKNLYCLFPKSLERVEKIGFNGEFEVFDELEEDEEENKKLIKILKTQKIDIVSKIFSHNYCEVRRCKCAATSEPFLSSSIFLHLSVIGLLNNKNEALKAQHPLVTRTSKRFQNLQQLMPPKVQDLISNSTKSFSDLLKKSLTEGKFECPTMKAKCPVNQVDLENTLLENPKTFCLTFNWISEFTHKTVINELMETISVTIDVTRMFKFFPEMERRKSHHIVKNSAKTYRLTGFVAYYGKHYTSYVFHSKKQTWVYCDDSRVRVVGNWKKVKEHVLKNKHQAELLIYSNVDIDFVKQAK